MNRHIKKESILRRVETTLPNDRSRTGIRDESFVIFNVPQSKLAGRKYMRGIKTFV
jgi:hypothetical protein